MAGGPVLQPGLGCPRVERPLLLCPPSPPPPRRQDGAAALTAPRPLPAAQGAVQAVGGTHLPLVAGCPRARAQGSPGLLPRPHVPLIASRLTPAWGQRQSHPPASHALARDSVKPLSLLRRRLGVGPWPGRLPCWHLRETGLPVPLCLGLGPRDISQPSWPRPGTGRLHTRRHAPRGVGRGTGHSRLSRGMRTWRAQPRTSRGLLPAAACSPDWPGPGPSEHRGAGTCGVCRKVPLPWAEPAKGRHLGPLSGPVR